MSAAVCRYSSRVDFALPGIKRTAAVRFSVPQLEVDGGELVEERVHERRILALTQPGITEHARRHRGQLGISLLANRLRCLFEEPELELARSFGVHAAIGESFQDATQKRSRARRVVLAVARAEVAEECGGRGLAPRLGKESIRRRIDDGDRVRVSRVPTG